MDRYLRSLEELLPGHLHEILEWEFIPWDHLKDRHSDLSGPHLTALFEAYLYLNRHLDLKTQASQTIPEKSWGCMRCGFCCTSMRPKAVRSSTYQRWEKADAPVAWFYSFSGKVKKGRDYRCWYHNGIRLRICPFMFINLNDSRSFCSIYPMGDNFRPPACSSCNPRHETCRPDIGTVSSPYLGQELLHE